MSKPLLVQLDIQRMLANLADVGDPIEIPELLQWLEDTGFRVHEGGWWACEEISLESLDRSEILQIRGVHTF